MKRESNNFKEIKIIKSRFFWNKCIECGSEYKNETMYKTTTGPYYGGDGIEKYICSHCASNIEEAYSLFNPVNPPPPPPPRIIKGNL